MAHSKLLGTVALIGVPGIFLGSILSLTLLTGPADGSGGSTSASCGSVSVTSVDGKSIEGYSEDQLKNAAAIIAAGKSLSLSVRGQTISVMVAIGESALRVLDYGDGPGPDSRGLFQQRENGAWGSYADRMDPTISATNFIKGLQAVPGWESLEPTIAGHRVQRNADPYHYEKFWSEAVKIVEALADGTVPAGDCAIAGKSGSGDDYPWKTSPTWLDVGVGPASTSPLNFYYRECVDFALWRVNQQMGSSSEPFKFLNGTFRPDGAVLGSAVTWKDGWDAKGWPTGSVPRVGAVVWYAPGTAGADPKHGHVAVVQEVKEDGSYIEEGYNGEFAPNDHNYYTRTVQSNVPSAFLYLPNQEEKK